ncbi:hypothetical protein PP175_00460 [Aneurinibacillus sp. Ricciae_BoGa-3]|uniref:hypothetical protein n=1 Tax=Aneurinibacillus sp. Ricciae_BoGa-3 TaxID=3022697 RepID=UPI002341FB7E|nr:hypothetical protein [Aneurinibacillus sp. Ricciae_BoGa-3]WCK54585.1 hypothetical protein PP175_00460 [Aneurinibacillus sp. Ricciae_BoGa-3]
MFRNKGGKARVQKLVLIWPSILLLLGLIVYPFASILLQSMFPQLFDTGFSVLSFSSFAKVLKTSYTYKAIVDALLFGGGASVLSAVIGTFLAVLVHRKWVYGQRFINLVVWIIFFTPSYLVAEGWVLMMQQKGILSGLFSLKDGSLDWFFTPAGLIAAMAFRLFPVVYLSVMAGLREEMRFELVRIFKQLDMTVVYVTHDQMEAD